MPQSLSLVIVHVIFSTKDRVPMLDAEVRSKLHAYLATVARNAGCEAHRVASLTMCIWPSAFRARSPLRNWWRR